MFVLFSMLFWPLLFFCSSKIYGFWFLYCIVQLFQWCRCLYILTHVLLSCSVSLKISEEWKVRLDCNDCKYKKNKYVIKSVLNLIKNINNKFINQQLLYLQKKKTQTAIIFSIHKPERNISLQWITLIFTTRKDETKT